MTRETARPLELSIIVAAPQYSPSSLEHCLKALRANNLGGAEVIVAAGGAENLLSNFVADYPEFQFVPVRQAATLPFLLAAGLNQAKGEIIAVTDSSCVVADNWVQAILRAQRSAAQPEIIGGAVAITGPKNSVDWAAYICDYAEFIEPFAGGAANAVPGNNLSFKRALLTDVADFGENGFWKTLWCQEQQARGITLKLEPSIVVYFVKSYDFWAFLKRRFQHGRCFAGMRCLQSSVWKRAFYLFGSLCLPFVFLPRMMRPMLVKKRFLKQLFFSLPVIILAVIWWSFGETCGYLAGAGKSCETIW